MNVERVNDPLWMQKPPPEKSEVQVRAHLVRGVVKGWGSGVERPRPLQILCRSGCPRDVRR